MREGRRNIGEEGKKEGRKENREKQERERERERTHISQVVFTS